jgi:hypothetical protein
MITSTTGSVARMLSSNTAQLAGTAVAVAISTRDAPVASLQVATPDDQSHSTRPRMKRMDAANMWRDSASTEPLDVGQAVVVDARQGIWPGEKLQTRSQARSRKNMVGRKSG